MKLNIFLTVFPCVSFSKSTNEDRAASCKPVNKILFLKTHKTGSSTLTNILNRYGDDRDLLFALPVEEKAYHFFWPRSFKLRYTTVFGKAPNILCNHARYNKAPMNWLFPKETTRYITMLREPSAHFESIFNFFRLGKRFKEIRMLKTPLASFLQKTAFYFDQVKHNLSGALNLIKNPSLFELGLDPVYHENSTVVENYIRFLQKEFDLVMLMEYFDESLVLLKRRLCWQMEDILYFKLNERVQKEKQNVPTWAREEIKKWNSGDVLLYDAFNKTFWEKIKEEGPEFYKDLALFTKAKQAMEEACLRKGKFLTKPYTGRFVQGYAVKGDISKELNETCNRMITNEIPFLEHHRNKLIKFYKNIDNTVHSIK